MPNMMTNYMGRTLNGMGRASGEIYMRARHGADTALANDIARYAVPAGLGIVGAGMMANGHPIFGAIAMGMGGYTASRGISSGAYGDMAGWGGASGKMQGYKNRMRERVLGQVGSPGPGGLGSFRAGFYSF